VDQHISEMVSSEANKPVEANMAVAEKHETLESFFSRNFDPSKFHLKATKIAWRWLEDHRKYCHNVVPPQF